MNPQIVQVVHVAETGALIALGGACDFALPYLTTGHVGDWHAFMQGAGIAAVAAVVSRIRGLQFGALRGFALGLKSATVDAKESGQ